MNSALVIVLAVAMSIMANAANINKGITDSLVTDTMYNVVTEQANEVRSDVGAVDDIKEVYGENTGVTFKCSPILMQVINVSDTKVPGVRRDQFYHMHNMWQGMEKKNVVMNNTCYLKDCEEVYNISVSVVDTNEVPKEDKCIYDRSNLLISFAPGIRETDFFREENTVKKAGKYTWYSKKLVPVETAHGSVLYSNEAVAFDNNMRYDVIISMHVDETIPKSNTYGEDKEVKLDKIVDEILSTFAINQDIYKRK